MTAPAIPSPVNIWSRYGRDLSGFTALPDAMAAAGLNYETELRDLAIRVPTAGDDFYYAPTELGKAVVRTDNGATFGIVGPEYVSLRNATAFSVVEPLLDAGIASLVAGGTMRGGRDAYLQVSVDPDKLGPKASGFFGREGIRALTSVINNHAGRRSAMFFNTPVRIVCENTLRAAVKGFTAEAGVKVRHTKHVEKNFVVGAEKTLAILTASFETVAADFAALKHRIITAAEFEAKVLDVVAPDPRKSKAFRADSRKADSSVERAEKRRAELTRMWTEGKGHTGDLSAWEAWNGVVEALDHDASNLWSSERTESRLVSDLDGAIGQAKTKTLRALLAK